MHSRTGATSDAKQTLSEWTSKTWPARIFLSRSSRHDLCWASRERNCLELARDSILTGCPASVWAHDRTAVPEEDGTRGLTDC